MRVVTALVLVAGLTGCGGDEGIDGRAQAASESLNCLVNRWRCSRKTSAPPSGPNRSARTRHSTGFAATRAMCSSNLYSHRTDPNDASFQTLPSPRS